MYQTLVDTQIGDKKELVENGYKVVFSNFLIKNNVNELEASNFQANYKKLQDEFYSTHDKETEHHDFKKLLNKTFIDFYKIDINDEALSNLIWQYRKATRGDTKLYPHIKETLEPLSKDYKIYLASYTQASYSLLEIEELGIKNCFSGFIFSSDIGYKKMNDEFYKKCISISGTTPENCVMIGDNKLEDMYMANKNGMKTIWIKNPITLSSNLELEISPTRELEIGEFSKLKDILETI